MKTSANNMIKTLATGLVVLVFFAIGLFWLRFGVEARLLTGLPDQAKVVVISPSSLLPRDVETSPDVTRPSVARCTLEDGAGLNLMNLGLTDYILSRFQGGPRSDIFYSEVNPVRWMYFDRSSGKLVMREPDNQTRRLMIYYVGPEGLSDSPEDEVGRFIDPVNADTYSTGIIYDRVLRRFYRIDTKLRQVKVGPELDASPDVQPVRIGRGWSEALFVRAGWEPPQRVIPREEGSEDARTQDRSEYVIPYTTSSYYSVVDASGRIDLLDTRALTLVRGKGYLPNPLMPSGNAFSRPSQLLGFDVVAVGAGAGSPYIGLVACSLSRQGTSASLAVYDESGSRVAGAGTEVGRYEPELKRREMPSAQAVLWHVPWGPASTIAKYVLESIHPPVLTVVSFWMVDQIEARAGHRSLFLLPDSFVALHRSQVSKSGLIGKFFEALWMMVPAFLLAGFLAWRVARDMALLGRSKGGQGAWFVATLMFSVPAYITYRLTRPKGPLVTCTNCGRPRRPDTERCHHCRSPWSVPELIPPTWRVFDNGPAAPKKADESEKTPLPPEQNPDLSVELM